MIIITILKTFGLLQIFVETVTLFPASFETLEMSFYQFNVSLMN